MFKHIATAALLTLFASAWCPAAPAEGRTVWTREFGDCRFAAETNCPDARAEVGDDIRITVSVESPYPGYLAVDAYQDGIPQGEKRYVKFGEKAELAFKALRPGSVALICPLLDAQKRPLRLPQSKRGAVGYFGVVISPDKIAPGNPVKPADFDKFWAEKRAELDAVPLKAERREVPLPERMTAKYPDVVCHDVRFGCSGGVPVSGYLCMPRNAKPKSLPAIVIFPGAGVRSARMNPEYGKTAIAFDFNAHGIENGKSADFYRKLYRRPPLKGYRLAGWDDHRNTYFMWMTVRAMRALDYVKSLPEWDGKTLVVTGASQGGSLSLAAAALDHRVSLCVAKVPSLCDLGAGAVKRRPGGPLHSFPVDKQRDPALIREAAYLDNVFFAERIKCPVYLTAGLGDILSGVTGVYAFYNRLPQDTFKHITLHPCFGHANPGSEPGTCAIHEALKME